MIKPLRILAILIPVFVLSCAQDAETPEAQVRKLIKEAESAAENKHSGVLREFISERYRDSEGRDKRTIEGIIRYYFLRNQSIHLLTRTQAIRFPQPKRAEATVFVAMAGQPISSMQELPRIRADLHRFDIVFVTEDGAWKVVSAEWRRAVVEDFLRP